MSPGLRDGDWLLVDAAAFQGDVPGIGDLVVARSEGMLLVKRVAALSPAGEVQLSGDAPSIDGHRHDAIVALSAVEGRPWFRYWPPSRIGRVR
jgi:signal peptidase I